MFEVRNGKFEDVEMVAFLELHLIGRSERLQFVVGFIQSSSVFICIGGQHADATKAIILYFMGLALSVACKVFMVVVLCTGGPGWPEGG